jgi:hypothetical protein
MQDRPGCPQPPWSWRPAGRSAQACGQTASRAWAGPRPPPEPTLSPRMGDPRSPAVWAGHCRWRPGRPARQRRAGRRPFDEHTDDDLDDQRKDGGANDDRQWEYPVLPPAAVCRSRAGLRQSRRHPATPSGPARGTTLPCNNATQRDVLRHRVSSPVALTPSPLPSSGSATSEPGRLWTRAGRLASSIRGEARDRVRLLQRSVDTCRRSSLRSRAPRTVSPAAPRRAEQVRRSHEWIDHLARASERYFEQRGRDSRE